MKRSLIAFALGLVLGGFGVGGAWALSEYAEEGHAQARSDCATAGARTGERRQTPAGPAREVPRFSHVVVLVLENKECGQIIGSDDAPYLNSLARRSALATSFYATAHPSLPNYLALTGGSTFGIASDCTDCHVQARNLVDELEAARITWKAYLEGMPSPCFQGSEAGNYAKKHNPFLYYDDIANNPARCSNVVPLTQLSADLRDGRLPAFAWISPDLCHDMHSCGVSDGDRFLSGFLPPLLHALGPRGVLFITWDEGRKKAHEGCCRKAAGGNVATIVAGPLARAGASSGVPYDHYSILRTIEDAWGLPRLGAAGCRCTRPLTDLFARS